MDEFDNSCQVVALAAGVTQCAASQEQKYRTQAFTASRDDVTRHLTHQGHAGIEPLGDHPVDFGHVWGDQFQDGGCAVFRGRQMEDPAGCPGTTGVVMAVNGVGFVTACIIGTGSIGSGPVMR